MTQFKHGSKFSHSKFSPNDENGALENEFVAHIIQPHSNNKQNKFYKILCVLKQVEVALNRYM